MFESCHPEIFLYMKDLITLDFLCNLFLISYLYITLGNLLRNRRVYFFGGMFFWAGVYYTAIKMDIHVAAMFQLTMVAQGLIVFKRYLVVIYRRRKYIIRRFIDRVKHFNIHRIIKTRPYYNTRRCVILRRYSYKRCYFFKKKKNAYYYKRKPYYLRRHCYIRPLFYRFLCALKKIKKFFKCRL